MTRYRKLSIATTAATLALVAVGALVRATGSGLGCPDWPRCFGRWIPPGNAHSIIEYSHRTVAAIAIVLIGAQALSALRRHRRERGVLVPALVAVVTVFVQAALGAIVVGRELDPTLVTLHFAVAMGLVAAVTAGAVNATCVERLAAGKAKEPVPRRVARLAWWSAGATAALLLAGAAVRGGSHGLAFGDWPLMDGRVIPTLSSATATHFLHRALALAAGALLVALAVRARRSRPRDAAVVWLSTAVLGLFGVQALVGAAQVWTRLAAAPRVAHVVLSSLIWASLVAILAVTRRLAACGVPPAPADRSQRAEPLPVSGGAADLPLAVPQARRITRAFDVGRAYFQLTKPRIILLLLVTTVPAMVLAARGVPSASLVAATLLGGFLSAGSANTFNCYIDRDIDSVMPRTRRRPLPSHRVSPRGAIAFGLALGAGSFALLWAAVNLLSAALATGAILFYVLVYTMLLKRSTPQNIVIGGAAGAVPVLVGWAAVTGRVGPPAAAMFAIVFLWTPPHFWALAMRFADEYAAAGVPMLPVVRGPAETTRQIAWYSVATVAATLALWPVGRLGAIYGAAALVLGAELLRRARRLRREATAREAMALFRFSITYLALIFAAIAADRLLLG